MTDPTGRGAHPEEPAEGGAASSENTAPQRTPHPSEPAEGGEAGGGPADTPDPA